MKLVAKEGGRADVVVGRALAGPGRKRIAEAFAAGQVRVNGRRARKGDRIVPGDRIDVDETGLGALDVVPWEAPFEEILVDEKIVAANKPAMWPSHPLRPGETGTFANALVARHPGCAGVGKDPREAGLVHRLDAGTSGVIVAARRQDVWDEWRAAFAEGRVAKEYQALVIGPLEGDGLVEEPIGGLPAVTRWRVEKQLGDRTLVRCRTETGRMHQVRVHMAAIGHPLVGDVRYGGPEEPRIEGHFLHASRIVFGGYDLVARLPEDRARLI